MTVEIPSEFQQFVQHVINNGSFDSEAEVVSAALRLLRQRELGELRKDIDAAAEQLDRGEGIEIENEEALRGFFDDIKRRGRERFEAKQNAK